MPTTCKSWSKTARKYMYSYIRLDSCHPLTRLSLLTTITESPTKPGQLTKTLELGRVCCNTLEFMNDSYVTYCYPNVEYLCGSEACIEFWVYLYKERNNGSWVGLKQIPKFSTDDRNNYCTSALAFRNTLESLQLHFYNKSYATRILSQQFNNMIQNLHRFAHLRSLVINYEQENEYDDDVDEDNDRDNCDFDLIVNSCSSSLNSITLNVDSEFVQWYQDLPLLLFNRTDLSIITQQPNIKYFKGYDFLYTAGCVRYFMHKFPSLCNLDIQRMWSRLDAPKEVLLNFFRFVARIPKFKLDEEFLNNTIQLNDTIDTFMESGSYPTLTIVLNYFDPVLTVRWSEAEEIDYVAIHNYKDDDRFNCWTSGTTILYMDVWFEHVLTAKLRHMEILHTHSSKILQLRFNSNLIESMIYYTNIATESLHDDNEADYAISLTLDHIFEQCKHLNNLSLKQIRLNSCSHNTIINNSMTRLEVNTAFVYPDCILPQLSVRLPSLKHLVSEDCTFVGERVHNHVHIHMPNTSFESITWSTKGVHYEYPYNSFTIKVCTTDGD